MPGTERPPYRPPAASCPQTRPRKSPGGAARLTAEDKSSAQKTVGIVQGVSELASKLDDSSCWTWALNFPPEGKLTLRWADILTVRLPSGRLRWRLEVPQQDYHV